MQRRRMLKMRIGLREANRHFSRLMKAVRNGTEVVLTERGRPVAKLVPMSEPDDAESNAVERAVRRLEAQGILRAATKRGRLPRWSPRKIVGGSLAQTIKAEREQR
jgi:prevent-host-death family protein